MTNSKKEVSDFFQQQQLRERKSLGLVQKKREELIKKGHYPPKFSMPLGLQLEITSQCNLSCAHCYNKSGSNNFKDMMGPDQWISLCEDIVTNGGIFQATISGGEPLLLGDSLFKMLDILAKDGTIFNFISNGFLFDKAVMQKLLAYNFYWVQISIDSSEETFHDQFRGAKGSWKRAINAALLVSNSGLPLRVATTVTPDTKDNIDSLVKMALDLGATYFVVGDVFPSGRAYENSGLFLDPGSRREFLQKVQTLADKYSDKLVILGSGSIKTQLEYASQPPIDGAIIRPDGSVRLDCSSPFIVGNVLKESFSRLWKKIPSDCWNNETVKKYIDSVDYVTGTSDLIKNYCNVDVAIF